MLSPVCLFVYLIVCLPMYLSVFICFFFIYRTMLNFNVLSFIVSHFTLLYHRPLALRWFLGHSFFLILSIPFYLFQTLSTHLLFIPLSASRSVFPFLLPVSFYVPLPHSFPLIIFLSYLPCLLPSICQLILFILLAFFSFPLIFTLLLLPLPSQSLLSQTCLPCPPPAVLVHHQHRHHRNGRLVFLGLTSVNSNTLPIPR